VTGDLIANSARLAREAMVRAARERGGQAAWPHAVLGQYPEMRPEVHPGQAEAHAAGGHDGLGAAVSN
jgi:hypothetical protein